MLRAHLEGSGISAYVRDENTVSMDWMLSNAIGGVKVEVHETDYKAAAGLLADFRCEDVGESKVRKRMHPLSRYVKFGFGAFAVFAAFGLLAAPSVSFDTVWSVLLPSGAGGCAVGLLFRLFEI